MKQARVGMCGRPCMGWNVWHAVHGLQCAAGHAWVGMCGTPCMGWNVRQAVHGFVHGPEAHAHCSHSHPLSPHPAPCLPDTHTRG
eukprot:363732-Chlamydomonas_euryale.AAC.10